MRTVTWRAFLFLVVLALSGTACGRAEILNQPGVSLVSPPGQLGLCDPAWSPDGSKLAVNSGMAAGDWGPDGKIHILDLATGELSLLLEAEPGTEMVVQSWSPDGQKIAFAITISVGNPSLPDEGIWVVNADGSGEPYFVGKGRLAAWSPTGEQMAIAEHTRDPKTGKGVDLIWVQDLATGNRRLVFSRSEGSFGWALSWSPDGTRLAFALGTEVGQRTYQDIYLLDLPTGTLNQLTHDGHSEYPTWSPDGSLIAYRTDVGKVGEYAIMIARADGTCDVPALNVTGYLTGTAWSPDGQKIAFVWGGSVYVLDIAAVLGEDFLRTGPVCP